MEPLIEKLNAELVQAQILLRASHDLYEDILVETALQKLSPQTQDRDKFHTGIGARLSRFANRDQEIRRMLARLQKLGKSSGQAA